MQGSARPLPLPTLARDCGNYDIRITGDGKWHYQGSPIERMALVRLFASVLTRDGAGDYWLETPAERGRIRVDDAPFLAVEVAVEGAGPQQGLRFRTNIGDWVTADAAHPIQMRPAVPGFESGGARPYVTLRPGIEALITRPVYYELVELAVEQRVAGLSGLGVWSGGAFFPLTPPAAHQPNAGAP